MNIAMGNFSGEFIIFMQDEDQPRQFTAEKYKQITGLPVPRKKARPWVRSVCRQLHDTNLWGKGRMPTNHSLFWWKWQAYWNIKGASRIFWRPREDGKGLRWSRQRKRKSQKERKGNLDVEVRMAKEQAEWLERLWQSRWNQAVTILMWGFQCIRTSWVWLPEHLIQTEQFQKFMTGLVLYPLHRNISVSLLFNLRLCIPKTG